MYRLFALGLAAMLLGGCAAQKHSDAVNTSTSLAQVQPAKIVDVRTPEEYQGGHVRGAVNVPVDEIQTGIVKVAPEKDTPLVLYCRSGNRSARAKAALEKAGYTNIRDLGSFANAKAELEGHGK